MALRKDKDGKWININAEDAQVGLFNAKAEFNFYSNGGASATGSLLSTAAPEALKGLAATGMGQSIPIVGQALAIITGAISIGQMIAAQKTANDLYDTMEMTKAVNKIRKQNLSLALWAADQRITQNNNKIAFAQKLLLEHKTVQVITMGILAMSTMAFAYGIKTSN